MQAIRTIQNVEGPTLTVTLPPDFTAKQVEVIVLPLDGALSDSRLPPELDPRYSQFIVAKPPLTEGQKKEFEKNPYPLRGTGGELIDPFEPAVPEEDWEVFRDDPA